MKNVNKDHYRRMRLRETSEFIDELWCDRDSGVTTGEDAVLGAEISQAIADLPHKQRQIFCRAIVDQLKYHEVAEEMEIPIGTVMTNIFRARRKLQERFAA